MRKRKKSIRSIKITDKEIKDNLYIKKETNKREKEKDYHHVPSYLIFISI